MIAYLDSSVILRFVLGQPGALAEWGQIDAGITSALTEVECLRTLDRFRLSEGGSDLDLAGRRELVFSVLRTLTVVDLARQVLDRAALPLPTSLGTLDALHLATAQIWREQSGSALVMATHDLALATAARSMGLTVVGVASSS